MKTKLKLILPTAFCALFGMYLITDSQGASAAVISAAKMCAFRLIPSLFPFFVLSALLRGLGIARILSRAFSKPFRLLFGISGVGALPLALGFTGGYPVGVKTVCDMFSEGEVSEAEANRLLLFCGNTGPAFIIGAAGLTLFSSLRAGLVLYFSHMISALLIGILCRIIFGEVQGVSAGCTSAASRNFTKIFTSAVSDSLFSCLNITAFVMIFSVLNGLFGFFGVTDLLCGTLGNLGFDPVKTEALITGALELGSGLDALTAFSRDISFSMPACAFVLSWGGISVHCQAMSFLSETPLKKGGYVAAKLCHGLLAAVLVFIFLRFGDVDTVFAFWGHARVKDFIFDYLGLFFSLACALAALSLHLIRLCKHRNR